MSDIRGTWKHYKGHIYEALGIAKHSETLEELGVAYQRRDTDELTVWVRPEEMFRGRAQLDDGSDVVRFERLTGETSVETVKTLRARIKDLEEQLARATEWSEDDKPVPEDEAILSVHPATCENPNHDLYIEAMRLVGAKRSKYALVDLVNWLLVRLSKYEK